MTQTPEQIAAGLTKAQREAMLTGQWVTPHIGREPFYVVRFTGDAWPQGVANYLSTHADTLTPLGQQVRTILENRNDAG